MLKRICIFMVILLLFNNCENKKIPTTIIDTPEPMMDIDGNSYEVVRIGDQVWMAENLKVKHYQNGDPIPYITDYDEWHTLKSGAYCAYENDEKNADTYGYLYNWYAVNDSRGLAPAGWIMPRNEEWQKLDDYFEVSTGDELKEAGNVHWFESNVDANNKSGFTALPGGKRIPDGYYFDINLGGFFWSSSEADSNYAYIRLLTTYSPNLENYQSKKTHGMSIRLVKSGQLNK